MNSLKLGSTSIEWWRSAGCRAALLTTTLIRVMAAQPGELDPDFVPTQNNFGLTAFQAGDRLFGSDGSQTFRFLPNGHWDPNWHGVESRRPFVRGDLEFADGRLILGGTGFGLAVFAPDGALLVSSVNTGFRGIPRSIYPNPDGSVVYSESGPWPESLDQNLQRSVFLPAGPPWEASGFPDSPSFVTIRDTSGRFIVAGTISRADGLERIGLLRLLSDRTLDATWNPGPALGLTLNEASIFNGVPLNIIACPHDEVEVILYFPAKPNGQRIVFARIRGDGSIARTRPVEGPENVRVYPMVAQSDGRFFVAGSFTNWNGQPVTSLVRLNADGGLDPTFQVVLKSTGSTVMIHNMGIQADGYLWISGDFTSVNGVSRPGLARIFAYAPPPSPPSLTLERYPARVGTNEFLYVSAKVEGFPAPSLQWLSNGIPIFGATYRGLRLAMDDSGLIPHLELVAGNAVDVVRLTIPPIQSARRTLLPGTRDAAATVELPGINFVTSWLALPEGGSVLAGTASVSTLTSPLTDTEHAMLTRLDNDWHVDASFGNGGVRNGNGSVEKLLLEPDGRIWAIGHFTKFAGQAVAGSVLLDPKGQIVEAPWPELDNPHLTAGLKLPGGKRLLAGLFNQVNGQAAYRLVRLDATGQVDPTFTSPLSQG